MTPERAETIGLLALGWLAASDDLLPVFMGATGTAPEDLRARVGDPEFLVAVLDFLTMDDAWVIAFCQAQGLSFEDPLRARQSLPGGGDMHWT